ncbi:MAG TPA: response regulator transcription factor [Solirubrobacteraceae bacterium]|jgi:DNA-binding response OmpR family regulator
MSGMGCVGKGHSILVVEYDSEVGASLVEQLSADGYEVCHARTAEHARALACAAPPGLVILGDLDSGTGALELLIEIRAGDRQWGEPSQGRWGERLPAILVCSRAQEPDLLRAFAAGADDFLARPARYLELRARMRALLARAGRDRDSTRVRVGPLAMDTATRAVSLRGRCVVLRRLEYELLLVLAREPTRVFTKHELMRLVWGCQTFGSTRTLDSHASRLRHKLTPEDSRSWVINVRGVGYRLI